MLHTVKHKFNRKVGKETPKISTSSLPDIIFILLFFFMVITVMKDDTVMVRTALPKATELQKMEKKELVKYMFYGYPRNEDRDGTAPRLQLGDAYADKEDVGEWVNVERSSVPEVKKPALIWSLKADSEVTMGKISDLKQELRKADALKLNYSTLKRAEVY